MLSRSRDAHESLARGSGSVLCANSYAQCGVARVLAASRHEAVRSRRGFGMGSRRALIQESQTGRPASYAGSEK